MPAIHENLRLLRQARGMTQAAVAQAISVTRQTVSGYETGRTQPDLETLKRLAELYGADLSDILYGTNRLQKRLKMIYRICLGLSALLLLGILVHAAILWSINHFVVVPPRAAYEQFGGIAKLRFFWLEAAALIVGAAGGLFRIGCLVLSYPVAVLRQALPPHRVLIWSLGVAVAAHVIVLPFALTDPLYGLANYLLPVWGTLPALLLVDLVSLTAWAVRRLRRKSSEI